MGRRRILLVVNPVAGVHSAPEKVIREAMKELPVEYDLVLTKEKGHAVELAREGAEQGVDIVAAAGGDGTLNEVGRGLKSTDVPMGMIPCGSGNALARFLGIPLDIPEACHTLVASRTRALDVGHIGDQIFISTAGVGLDAEVCARFNNRGDARRGLTPYVVASLQTFLAFRPTEVKLTLAHGETIVTSPTLLTFSNTGAFGNGVFIAPEAVADDGVLDVSVIETTSLVAAAWHSRRLFSGTIHRAPFYRAYRASSCQLTCPEPPLFQIDGEDVRATTNELKISVEQRVLNVAVPEAA